MFSPWEMVSHSSYYGLTGMNQALLSQNIEAILDLAKSSLPMQTDDNILAK
jgi:hypothetical protein